MPSANSSEPARQGAARKTVFRFVFGSWRAWLLVFVPATAALELAHAGGLWVFLASAVAIVPLAGLLGEATEELALHVGPTAGGLMNVTLGNLGELIIAFFALRSGHIDVVQASITGSIIGNALLVFGLSAFVGGLGRAQQKFNRVLASVSTTMLTLAVAALVMPAVFDLVVFGSLKVENRSVVLLSEWTALVLILMYAAQLVFTFVTHKDLTGAVEQRAPHLSLRAALALLVVAAALVGWLSEVFVGAIEPATAALGMSKLFVGVIVVAMIGNAAEHAAAVMMARQDKMDLAVAISIGSSVQIALLVAPLLVIASFFMPHRLSLVFNPFEIAAVVLSVLIVHNICQDGETNWLEGLLMVGLYLILAIAFFFIPA